MAYSVYCSHAFILSDKDKFILGDISSERGGFSQAIILFTHSGLNSDLAWFVYLKKKKHPKNQKKQLDENIMCKGKWTRLRHVSPVSESMALVQSGNM